MLSQFSLKVSKQGFKDLFIALCVVVLLLFPSQLALNSPWTSILTYSVVFYISLFSFLVAVNRSKPSKKLLFPLLMTIPLMIFAVIGSYQNSWTRPVFSYGVFSAVFLVTFTYFSTRRFDRVFVEKIVIIFLFFSFLVIIAGLFDNGLSFYRYSGVFHNPNNMGWFASGMASVVLGLIYSGRFEFEYPKKFFLYIVLSVFVAILLASNSRGALFALILSVLVFLFIEFSKSVSMRSIRLSYFNKYVAFIFGLVAISVVVYQLGLLAEMIEKFVATAERGDISQSRLEAWEASLRHWTYFGLGANYEFYIGREGLHSGHNTFISQLSRYGLLAATSFYMILLYIWFCAYKGTVADNSVVAPILLAVLTAFLGNSMFETGAAVPGVWLSLLLYSLLVSELSGKSIAAFKR